MSIQMIAHPPPHCMSAICRSHRSPGRGHPPGLRTPAAATPCADWNRSFTRSTPRISSVPAPFTVVENWRHGALPSSPTAHCAFARMLDWVAADHSLPRLARGAGPVLLKTRLLSRRAFLRAGELGTDHPQHRLPGRLSPAPGRRISASLPQRPAGNRRRPQFPARWHRRRRCAHHRQPEPCGGNPHARIWQGSRPTAAPAAQPAGRHPERRRLLRLGSRRPIPACPARYASGQLAGKARCREALLARAGTAAGPGRAAAGHGDAARRTEGP